MMEQELKKILKNNLSDTLKDSIQHKKGEKSLLIYDERTQLSKTLSSVYREILPDADIIHFDETSPEQILKRVDELPKSTLVILVQSTSFRLNEFRFRIELFKLGMKVIEHAHLERVKEAEFEVFAEGLAYDSLYYQKAAALLKPKIDQCHQIRVLCSDTELRYDSIFEDSKLNIGDYSFLKNVGGQFPIGEVFSEPKNLTQVNGELQIFAFGDKDFSVHRCKNSFKIEIKEGKIISASGAPAEFDEILEKVQKTEGKIWVRELGFGLNRAFTKNRWVSDAGSYERMCGVHLSVGMKHAMYRKEGFPKKQCKYHIDIFADVQKVLIDEEIVFEEGRYLV